jgi:type III restriction enzyme
VKTTDGTVWIVETKGREELDLPQKMARLRLWCKDATTASAKENGPEYRFAYVDQAGFQAHPPKTFAALSASFTEFQEN